jgi:hypothetical protein
MPHKRLENGKSNSGLSHRKNETNKKKEKKEEKKERPQRKKPQSIDNQVDYRLNALLGYGAEQLALENKHGIKLLKTPKQTSEGKLAILFAAVDQKLPSGRGSFATRKAMLTPSDLQLFRTFVSEMSTYLFGTQEPELRLCSDIVSEVYAAGNVSWINSIGWHTVNATLRADLTSVFDQVQIRKGTCTYMAYAVIDLVAADKFNAPVVGVIDYDSNGALGSFAIGMSYDSKKVFLPLVAYERTEVTWSWHSQGIPSLSWITTADTTTYVAYAKFISFATQTSGGNSGTGIFWFDSWCKFRQIVG